MQSIRIDSEIELERWALGFAKTLKPGDRIALEGELGVGKTSLVRKCLKALGWDEPVPSPSFPILIEYELEPHSVIHIDAFRLQSSDREAFDTADWEEKIVFLEWPERSSIDPRSYSYRIRLEFEAQEGARRLEIRKLDDDL